MVAFSVAHVLPFTVVSVLEAPSTNAKESRSTGSIVSPYFSFTATTVSANQTRFIRGIHSPASFARFS